MKINVTEIESAGIRAEARKAGIEAVELLGTYEHPNHPASSDWRLTLYQVGDVRVADTNGDPVWEEADPHAFAELLVQYGAA